MKNRGKNVEFCSFFHGNCAKSTAGC